MLCGVVLAPCLAAVALVSLWAAGWGFALDPVDRLREQLPYLVVAGLAGAAAGVALSVAVLGRRQVLAMVLLAVLGATPALLYPTDLI